MGKVVAGLLVSLDGVVESPNKWGWQQYMNAEMTEGIAAGVAQADAVLLGRRTYLDFATIWPKQGIDVPMARFLNSSPKYVASTTLHTLAWQPAILIKENLAGELTKLKQQWGKNILIPGSPRLVRSLLVDGLLDEISLNICPVVVGSGLHLFDDVTGSVSLELVASKTFSNGVLSVTYRPLPGVPQRSALPVSFPQATGESESVSWESPAKPRAAPPRGPRHRPTFRARPTSPSSTTPTRPAPSGSWPAHESWDREALCPSRQLRKTGLVFPWLGG